MRDNAITKRNFKDSLFRALFKRKREFLSLYNALSGRNLTDTKDMKLNTLASVLYEAQRNDVSFSIGDQLVVLVEQQSTVNGNMPLRMLLYLAEHYRRCVPKEALYKRQTYKIPAPQLYVLYVGDEAVPQKQDVPLSAAFAGETHDLELVTHVYNITAGKHSPLLKKCRTLYGYSEFVWQAESRRKAGMSRDDAIRDAVTYCMEHGILYDYLKQYEKEVYDMVSLKWDLDTALAVRGAEEREEGREEGRQEGRQEGILRGEDRMSDLIAILLEKGEQEELALAAKDKNERQRLFKKYNIGA